MTQYPHMERLIRLVAADNGIPVCPPSRWNWPDESTALEVMAAGLTDAEKYLVACGEETDSERLCKERSVEPLSAFLEEVFDGEYRFNFYEE